MSISANRRSRNRVQTVNRYRDDVLAPGWRQARLAEVKDVVLRPGMVLEDPSSGFCGAVVRWENGLVVLEDRKGKLRSFSLGRGLWLEGKPVNVQAPVRKPARTATHTASGSLIGPATTAKVALPSRIYVEGRHDADLIEKVWGADLRHVGVVVEYLGGIDDLVGIVEEFQPREGRRLGVLVDHLVTGTKESRIVEQIRNEFVFITGHQYIDIWQAVKPDRLGLRRWPDIPRSTDVKVGTCQSLGWPAATQADISRAWRRILGTVRSWRDLDAALVTEVEKLIDFVTLDHLDRES